MSQAGELVLVIDDSEIYRYFARVTLESANYQVALAASATSGTHTRQKALADGAHVFLEKDSSAEALIAAVRSAEAQSTGRRK